MNDSMNVELLNLKIAAMEVQILDQDDTIEALNRWIARKKEQCVKCKQKQRAEKAGMDMKFVQMFNESYPDDDCGCGGNCQVEGEDCKC